MSYQHCDVTGTTIPLPLGKVLCVGRNYMDHIQELNNAVPEQPLLFLKPSTAVVPFAGGIIIPEQQGECHNELEIAVLIQQQLTQAKPEQVTEAIWGYGLGLDLTLRDVQSQLKQLGQPWERAKAFDGSCPLSAFVSKDNIDNPQNLDFALTINNQLRQSGNSGLMINPIIELIAHMSQHFSLLPGDVVLTGTPKGVGPLHQGDQLSASLNSFIKVQANVI
ncbi:fumarylacetoacetate hydrolase family protein [Alteromonadaceae bacterium BrNp21-10]|nr:fumarylacetoacetate hydrolase family protein [Alteromonadaceae bacterium BrNp21-10]